MSGDRAGTFGAVALSRATAPAAADVHRPPRKYTLILPGALAHDLDADLFRLQAETGRRVDKSVLIRELVGLLHEDPTLYAQLRDRLQP